MLRLRAKTELSWIDFWSENPSKFKCKSASGLESLRSAASISDEIHLGALDRKGKVTNLVIVESVKAANLKLFDHTF